MKFAKKSGRNRCALDKGDGPTLLDPPQFPVKGRVVALRTPVHSGRREQSIASRQSRVGNMRPTSRCATWLLYRVLRSQYLVLGMIHIRDKHRRTSGSLPYSLTAYCLTRRSLFPTFVPHL